MIRVIFKYDPAGDEVDDENPTGLTSEAHDMLYDQLLGLGAEDIEIIKE
jgi:hypothetical protein